MRTGFPFWFTKFWLLASGRFGPFGQIPAVLLRMLIRQLYLEPCERSMQRVHACREGKSCDKACDFGDVLGSELDHRLDWLELHI